VGHRVLDDGRLLRFAKDPILEEEAMGLEAPSPRRTGGRSR
jgi:hypothetical protein